MRLVADLHIHSHYSMSTSPQLTPGRLELAARRKGIDIVGTGDATHPGWRGELREALEPDGAGLYRLRSRLRTEGAAPDREVRFVVSAEVSCIYRCDGSVRKVHSLVLLPDFEAADRLALTLARIGSLEADGRPVLALDSRDLLAMALESSAEALLVPAHVWTPWFSALGSRSGFDSMEECFRDLAGHVSALETGLSSDPPMNWRCSALDRYTLVSNSDAHSPDRLGREANILETGRSWTGLAAALRGGAAGGFAGTVEFFPEEGKYHLDGHRGCSIRREPELTRATGGRCPVCGKDLTVGVLHRVLELADRPAGAERPGALPFVSLVPLQEVLAEIAGVSAQSRAVAAAYDAVLAAGASELALLMDLPLEELRRVGGELLEEAVRRMRAREIVAEAGYDGEYGRISLFRPGEIDERSRGFLLPGLATPKRRAQRRGTLPPLPPPRPAAAAAAEVPVPDAATRR